MQFRKIGTRTQALNDLNGKILNTRTRTPVRNPKSLALKEPPSWCRAELWCRLLSNKLDTSILVQMRIVFCYFWWFEFSVYEQFSWFDKNAPLAKPRGPWAVAPKS